MRILRLFLGVIFLLPAMLRAADLTPVIHLEARKCAAAWQKEDYAGILAYLPPPVVKRAGGRAAALRQVKARFDQARSLGVERLEAFPGRPSAPKPFGRWLVSLVPLTAVVHHAHLDLTQTTHALGLSADQGKHWYFLLLYEITQAELDAWFPEFAGKILVPGHPPPELDVVF